MVRFKPGHKLGPAFYVRGDGTRAYYFTTDELAALFTDQGFESVTCEYIAKETSNRKLGICVPRVYAQGKFKLK
jgi:methyltransferase-like protein 6